MHRVLGWLIGPALWLAGCAGTGSEPLPFDPSGAPEPGAVLETGGIEALAGSASAAGVPAHVPSSAAYERSVVSVRTRGRAGSGIVLWPGVVVVNAHVVPGRGRSRGSTVWVTPDSGHTVRARLKAYSRTYDLAVLSVPATLGEPAFLADRPVDLGQAVAAAGSFRASPRLLQGHVVHTDLSVRHCFVPDRTERAVSMFAISARAGTGLSGSPVIDPTSGATYGMVVGVTDRYPDPQTGEWARSQESVTVALHMVEVVAEVERLLEGDIAREAAAASCR